MMSEIRHPPQNWSQISSFREKWPAAEKIVWTGTGIISARTNCRVPSAQDIELNERSRVVVCQLPSESDLRN